MRKNFGDYFKKKLLGFNNKFLARHLKRVDGEEKDSEEEDGLPDPEVLQTKEETIGDSPGLESSQENNFDFDKTDRTEESLNNIHQTKNQNQNSPLNIKKSRGKFTLKKKLNNFP